MKAFTPCPSGFYCGSTSMSAATPCPASYYCPPGTIDPSSYPCPLGAACPAGSGAPTSCPINTIAGIGAASCTPCSRGTYAATPASASCTPCGSSTAAATCDPPSITWRDSLTVVSASLADVVGGAANMSIALTNGSARYACGPVLTVTPSAVSCALTILPPDATNASLSYSLVAAAGAGAWFALNFTVVVTPPPPVTPATCATPLAPLSGAGRLLLTLPRPRPTAADWNATGTNAVQPPTAAVLDTPVVWLNGAPCTNPTYDSTTTVSCTPPPLDGVGISAVVQLAGAFNVTGVLPQPFAPPTLYPGATLALPPTGAASTLLNVTLPGSLLCAGGQPRLSATAIGGVPCGGFACTASDASLLCLRWNGSALAVSMAAAANGNSTVQLNVTATWVNAPQLVCTNCITAVLRPTLHAVYPSTITGPGAVLVVSLAGAVDTATVAPIAHPTVLVGGTPCVSLSRSANDPNLYTCTAPYVNPRPPTYPAVSVHVRNSAGVLSMETATVTYPAPFGVSWASDTLATSPIAALPSDPPSGFTLPLSPPPVLLVFAREAATCTIGINASTVTCAAPPASSLGRPSSLTVSLADPIEVPAVAGGGDGNTTTVTVSGLTVAGGGGCRALLIATCSDTTGQTATTADDGSALSNPTVTLPVLDATWGDGGDSLTILPSILPPLPARVSATPLSSAFDLRDASAGGALACVAVLLDAAALPGVTAVGGTTPLSRLQPQLVLASSTGVAHAAGVSDTATSVGRTFEGLDGTALRFGGEYAVVAECTWQPTGERLRLASRRVVVGNISVAITSRSSLVGSALVVDAYMTFNVSANLAGTTLGAPTNITAAGAKCVWALVSGEDASGASSSAARLATATAAVVTSVASMDDLAANPLPVVVEGPPDTPFGLQLVCTLWSNVVTSNVLPCATRAYALELDNATPRTVWPSGAVAAQVARLTPPLTFAAAARTFFMCTLTVNTSTCPSATSNTWGVGLGVADATPALVGDTFLTQSLAPDVTTAALQLPAVGIRAASGCMVAAAATCGDGVGRSATLSPAVVVTVGRVTATWQNASLAFGTPHAVVPTLPLPSVTLQLTVAPAALLPDSSLAALSAWIGCAGAIFDAAAAVPVTVPLATSIAAVASGEGALVATNGFTASIAASGTAIDVTLPALDTTALALGRTFVLHAECTWLPTSERVRMVPVLLPTVAANLSWAGGHAIGGGSGHDVAVVVLGGTAATVPMTLTITVPAGVALPGSSLTIAPSCSLAVVVAAQRAVINTVPWAANITLPTAQPGTDTTVSVAMAAQFVMDAPPNTTVVLRVTCMLLGHAVSSPLLRASTSPLAMTAVTTLPTRFIVGDAAVVTPVAGEVGIRVWAGTGADALAVLDVLCELSTDTPDAQLTPANTAGRDEASSNLLSAVVDATTGVAMLPAFGVSGSFALSTVDVVVSCSRPNGDAPPPLTFTMSAIRLRQVVCVRPPPTSPLLAPLTAFSFGIATAATPGGGYDDPCSASSAAGLQLPDLPPITCALSLNLNGSSITAADADNVFLIQATGVVAETTHIATFASFALTAPQDQVYDIVATCYVGSVIIPAPYHFLVTLSGCPEGMEPSSVTCVTCGGGEFSLGGTGGRCTGCPPVGATCIEGILTLKPAYYQPPRQRGTSMGPDSLLYPCFNAEACTLNVSTLAYGCAAGYTGALCGVCDADGGYAAFGTACRPCWNAAVTAFAVALVILVIIAVLTRVALRTSTTGNDAATVLRITMSFLQGVGSLRVFRAGSTLAYQNVMGWTDVVSASPLSVGFLVCVMRLPYLVQYIITVLLPVLAAGAVVLIFLFASTLQAVHCRPSCGFAATKWRAALVEWWRDRRAAATTLFVLFLAYMPITSASLRALDCTDAVDGVRYLRTNLSVECHVGQHAAARVLAYVVLVVVGIGFPLGLVWMLGTATYAQLTDSAFHATWGFLFDGYKAPAAGGGVLSGHAPGGGKADTSSSATVPNGTRPRRNSRTVGSRFAAWVARKWHGTGENRVWWEGVVLLRKAGVVLLAVMVTNPYLQCVGATLWFGGFLQLQVRYVPYAQPLFNRLELLSLTASVLTAVISTALLQYNVGVATADLHGPAAMTPIEWAVTLMLAFINMGTFLVLGGFWLWLQLRVVKGVARQASQRIIRQTSRAAVIAASWSPGGSRRKSIVGGAAAGTPSAPPVPARAERVVAAASANGGGDGIVLSSNPLRAAAASGGSSALVALPPTPTPGATAAHTSRSVPRTRLRRILLAPHAAPGSSTPNAGATTTPSGAPPSVTTTESAGVRQPAVVSGDAVTLDMVGSGPTSVVSALAAITGGDDGGGSSAAGGGNDAAPAAASESTVHPAGPPPVRPPPAAVDAAAARVPMPALTLRRGPSSRLVRPPADTHAGGGGGTR